MAATPPPRATASQSPFFSARFSFAIELADDGRLKAGGEVGAALRNPLRAELAAAVDQRRLQAAEAEVKARIAGHRHRHLEGIGIPCRGELLQRRAARVTEPQQPRDLVEGLAGGVVERLAEHLVPGVVADPRQQRVAAAGDEAEEGRLERLGLEEVGGDVALQVVDRDQRQPPRAAIALAVLTPTSSAPIRPGPRCGDGLDLVEGHPRLGQRRLDHRRGQLEVMARGDLGNDAAEARVRGGLRGDHVGEDPRAVENRRAGVVAGGLDREDQSSHMISASSPLSW